MGLDRIDIEEMGNATASCSNFFCYFLGRQNISMCLSVFLLFTSLFFQNPSPPTQSSDNSVGGANVPLSTPDDILPWVQQGKRVDLEDGLK